MPKVKNYCVSISQNLHSKIDRHVLVSKNLLKLKLTKHDWVIEAIKEKLEKQFDSSEITQEKNIGLHLDPLTHQRLGKHVDMIRQCQFSFSKKKWILDAIQERLDKEIEK
jgi:hypothetical protein